MCWFIVAPTVLTAKDREEISAFIANYKKDKSTAELDWSGQAKMSSKSNTETKATIVAAIKKQLINWNNPFNLFLPDTRLPFCVPLLPNQSCSSIGKMPHGPSRKFVLYVWWRCYTDPA